METESEHFQKVVFSQRFHIDGVRGLIYLSMKLAVWDLLWDQVSSSSSSFVLNSLTYYITLFPVSRSQSIAALLVKHLKRVCVSVFCKNTHFGSSLLELLSLFSSLSLWKLTGKEVLDFQPWVCWTCLFQLQSVLDLKNRVTYLHWQKWEIRY